MTSNLMLQSTTLLLQACVWSGLCCRARAMRVDGLTEAKGRLVMRSLGC